MFGISLIIIATAFEEFAESSSKRWIGKSTERLYSFGLLSVIWGAFLFSGFFLLRGGTIDVRSFPIIALRLLFEVFQIHLTINAIAKADRSTFGFLRILTIPLLLAVDVFLGYELNMYQLVGTATIVIALLFLFANHGLSRSGIWFVMGSAVNAVITISLYQYNIKHYNSIEVEQMIVFLFLAAYFMVLLGSRRRGALAAFFRENFLTGRSIALGAGSFLMSYAYVFAPASVIIAGKRASAVFASLVSGNLVFHEKHIAVKLIAAFLIVTSIVLLALS